MSLGQTSFGHDAYVNAEYMCASVKILTGFIEPHFLAGFSGGPKAVLPGVADERCVLANHLAGGTLDSEIPFTPPPEFKRL